MTSLQTPQYVEVAYRCSQTWKRSTAKLRQGYFRCTFWQGLLRKVGLFSFLFIIGHASVPQVSTDEIHQMYRSAKWSLLNMLKVHPL